MAIQEAINTLKTSGLQLIMATASTMRRHWHAPMWGLPWELAQTWR
jgi:hypothetical protein